jgi:MoaA/NifB/PqqE/SkfB family radical SAM enzyme
MEIEIMDKSLMMIFLLEECNLSCPHCVREDEPMDPGYRLSFRQLQLCLSDCRGLESIRWVHFSGGEPTLWTEGNRDLVDLLLEISKTGFTPGFTTNGSSFLDYDCCHDFLGRYVDGSTTPLRLYLSIDTFHGNFDVEKGRAQSLDNVTKCKRELPRDKGNLLDTRVLVVISKDFKSLLPDEMITHYESLGVAFLFIPMVLKGRAKALSHLCPDLDSDNPEDLGAYRRFHRKECCKEPGKIENRDKASNIILIGDDYYVYVDDRRNFRDQWRKVSKLGHLPDTIIHTYSCVPRS